MRDIYYIIYDIETLKILHVSKWFDKEVRRISESDKNQFINVTHPTSKDILRKLNKINGTDYN